MASWKGIQKRRVKMATREPKARWRCLAATRSTSTPSTSSASPTPRPRVRGDTTPRARGPHPPRRQQLLRAPRPGWTSSWCPRARAAGAAWRAPSSTWRGSPARARCSAATAPGELWLVDTGHAISYSSLIGPQGGLPVRGQQEAGDRGADRGQARGRLPDPIPGGQRGARPRPRGGLQTPARVPQCTRGRHSAQPHLTPHFPVVQWRRHQQYQHTQEAGQEERKERHPETQIFLRSST